jgi:hypothetical protein
MWYLVSNFITAVVCISGTLIFRVKAENALKAEKAALLAAANRKK